ncbi:MAG: ROK family protein [Parvularculaceae bacterium]|nr:ROK family protein [Parvularculaceae bacterium]
MRLIAGIDAGGTTFKLGVAALDGTLLRKASIPTTSPTETIAAAASMLGELAHLADGEIAALGIASFGPIDVDPASPDYGIILKTPKRGWSGAPLRPSLAKALGAPVVLDTDVNAALLAEMAAGAAQRVDRAAYVTIGTGVGVGVWINAEFAGRPFHPELGHIRVERHPDDMAFEGVCDVHGACLEGLVSAPALMARYGALETLPAYHAGWRIAGFYIAQLCLTLSLGWRVERIVLGGGVVNAEALLHHARSYFGTLMRGYLSDKENDPEKLIARAALGDDAGLSGAIMLAKDIGN